METIIILAAISLIVLYAVLTRRARQEEPSSVDGGSPRRVQTRIREPEAESPQELLKRATAAKKSGDIDAALKIIDQAALLAEEAGWIFHDRKSIYDKKRYYLTLAKRWEEVEDHLISMEQQAARTPEKDFRHWDLGWVESAKAGVAKGRCDFSGEILAAVLTDWHLSQALQIQRRLDEYEEKQVVEELFETSAAAEVNITRDDLRKILRKHRRDESPEPLKADMVALIERR